MIKRIEDISENEWTELLSDSDTVSWFQTRQAYDFFASIPQILTPLGNGVYRGSQLKGVCIGFVTMQSNPIGQFFTRRAIINGGPMLAKDATPDEVTSLMQAVYQTFRCLPWKQRPIYIETRNFNDYSRYKTAFATAGLTYHPHLDFHVPTLTAEQIEQNMDVGRRRNIRATIKAGATIVENPSVEQVRAFYLILRNLYRRKVRTPLFPLSFFEVLRCLSGSVFLLVEYNGRIIGGTVCVALEGKRMYEWYVCGEDGVYDGVCTSSYATYAGLQYAAKHKIPMLDMMGAGVPNVPNGVRDFKARFGGELVEYGRCLAIIHPILYRLGVCGVKLLRCRLN